MKPEMLVRWTRENAADLYGIRNWGLGYFDISESGEVIVRPGGPAGDATVNLMDLITGLKARGLTMPVLLRFADILSSRIEQLYTSFNTAIRDCGYKNQYRGVYPIKVNQQKQVVAEIVEFGRAHHHGLEAGSKAELMAAIAYTEDPEALIVCNGYKDEEYIDLALYTLKMGLQTILVIEIPEELDLILNRAAQLGIKPRLGVRVKLSSRAGGHWDGSGGDRSMFGVNAAQLITIIDRLRKENMLDGLQMLHFHLGSQVTNIRNIRSALKEACRFYVEIAKEGAAMGLLNIGGGLAVDYDGSHTNFASSRNYTEQEYAVDVVETIMASVNDAGIPHPMIVSESGRATVAYHSLLVFNILNVSRFEPHSDAGTEKVPDKLHHMLNNLIEVRNALSSKNLQECYHDAVDYRDEIRALFQQGTLSLRERAFAENIFWDIICRIAAENRERKYVPEELQGMEVAIADLYYANFSVFQSLPDSWAIDQLFPVMPIHRLSEMPTRQATIADITCDSDGKIDRFIDLHDVKSTLPLHEWNGEDYYVGVFLVGAYQETLGDLHNLLGDTNVLHVRIGKDGQVEYAHEISGDTVSDVLSYVEYDPREMINRVRTTAEQAVRDGRISAVERREIMSAYETGMRGYTYFET
ncbi:MAG: biosynthetic arginine decarboxylase [Verrucomicrobia bacterium]|nr:biosynthetic arginine decarboxylase [Verrucomicrobiota bacterium]MBU4291997.1 biosynthetic arginine decarboxylase [Verrucomicrobiota bacterium]MBU4427884.1 biosynthetic arginine decarboxylase [Verrucomicrobiota bacterium]MCG2678831.1 biosynthetic arginine decarboxylase [Kiritimatiellia bacterium]